MNNNDFDLYTAAQAYGIDGEPSFRQKMVLSLVTAPMSTFWNLVDIFIFALPEKLLGLDKNRSIPYEYTAEGICEAERIAHENNVRRIKAEMWPDKYTN